MLGKPSSYPTAATTARPFLSIPDVIARMNLCLRPHSQRTDSAPWITPLPALALGRLFVIGPVGVFGELHRSKDTGFLLPDTVTDLKGLQEIELLACDGLSGRIMERTDPFMKRSLWPRLDTRKPPETVDLFGKLKMGKQTPIREPEALDEESGYAPDVASILSTDMETTSETGHSNDVQPSLCL